MKKTTQKKNHVFAEIDKYIASIKAKYGYKSNKEISLAMGKNEVYLSSIRTRGLPKAFLSELEAKFPLAFEDVQDRFSLEKYTVQILIERVSSILVELSGGSKSFAVEAQKIVDEAQRLAEYDAKRVLK